jgi:GNAT superfamily N-acetyltransferase
MSLEIVHKQDPDAVRRILESLPDWFGDPEAIDNYVTAAGDLQFVSRVAVDGGDVVGVSLTRRHFRESAELHLIAADPAAQGRGTGRALLDQASADLRGDGCKMLSVHTVGPSFDNEPYARTRAFYSAMGFSPLEEHNNLDWHGPTLIMVRQIQVRTL